MASRKPPTYDKIRCTILFNNKSKHSYQCFNFLYYAVVIYCHGHILHRQVVRVLLNIINTKMRLKTTNRRHKISRNFNYLPNILQFLQPFLYKKKKIATLVERVEFSSLMTELPDECNHCNHTTHEPHTQ